MKSGDLKNFIVWSDEQYLQNHAGASNFVLKQAFMDKFDLYMSEARKKLLDHAKSTGFDVNKPGIQSKKINGVKLTLEVLNKNQREAKKNFQEKNKETVVGSYYDYLSKFNRLENVYNIDSRFTKEFLCGISSNNINLQLDNFISTMKSGASIEQKNALFIQYIEEAINVYKNTKIPENDMEGVENFKTMLPVGRMFSIDRIDTVFKDLTGSEIDPKTKELWKKYVNEYGDCTCYYEGLLTKLTDPLYPYFDDKSAQEFGKTLNEEKDRLGQDFEKMVNPNLMDMNLSLGDMGAPGTIDLLLKSGNFNKVKAQLDLKPDDVLFNEEGIKTKDAELNNIFMNDKQLYVQKASGERFAISNYKTGFVNIRQVVDVGDAKDEYKYALNVLNKGTRWYLPSSDEYKNMRNILGQLSRGEGNEIQLLKDLKINMDKYEENYFLKNNKSDIAKERMECVNRIKLGIQTVSDAKNYEAIVNKLVRENQSTTTKETEKVNESEDDYEKYGEEATHDIDGFEIDLDKQPTQKSAEESNRHQMPLNELNEANTIESSVKNNDIIEEVNVNENIVVGNNVKNS